MKQEKNFNKQIVVGGVVILFFINLGGWTLYLLWGQQIVHAMHEGRSLSFFNLSKEYSQIWSVQDLLDMIRKILLLLSGLTILIGATLLLKKELFKLCPFLEGVKNSEDLKRKIFSVAVWLGCSWLCFYALYSYSYQGEWYQIEKIMKLSGGPPYQQRILFVWVANGIRWIFPGSSYLGCYFISQIIPIVLSFYFIKKWGELFISKELAFLSQILLVLLLIPTFKYYTFYDIGTVLFYTLCLFFLFKRHFYFYFLMLVLGTFNHEITLFLIFIFAAIYLDSDLQKKYFLKLVIIQIILYGVVRIFMFWWLPAPSTWDESKVWFNIDFILHHDRRFWMVILNLIFWYIIAFLGISSAPKELKRSTILLPFLFVTTFLVGQFNEIRLFDAFIPVGIALFLCLVSSIMVKE